MSATNPAKTLVTSFFDKINAGAIPDAFTLVSDDVAWWVAGALPFSGTKSKAQYMGVVNAIQDGFPAGLAFTVRGLVGEGDAVAAEVESFGQHKNGRTYQNRYHFLFRVQGGVIREVKEYMDTQHLKDLISP